MVCLSTEHDQNHDTLEYSFSEKDYTLFLPKIKGFQRRLYLISCVSLKLHLCTSLRGNQRQIQSYD